MLQRDKSPQIPKNISMQEYILLNWKCFVLLFNFSSFGMVHDGEGNVCKKSEGNIMSPTLAGHNGIFSWSACSRQYLSRFLK